MHTQYTQNAHVHTRQPLAACSRHALSTPVHGGFGLTSQAGVSDSPIPAGRAGEGVGSAGQTDKDKMVRKERFISSLRIYYKLSDLKGVKEQQTPSANSEGASGTVTSEPLAQRVIPGPQEATQSPGRGHRTRAPGAWKPQGQRTDQATQLHSMQASRQAWRAPAGPTGHPCFDPPASQPFGSWGLLPAGRGQAVMPRSLPAPPWDPPGPGQGQRGVRRRGGPRVTRSPKVPGPPEPVSSP